MKQNIFRKVSRFVPVLVAAVAVTGCDAHIDVPDTAVRPGHVLCEDGTALSYTEYQQSREKAVAVVFDTRQHEGAEGNGYAVYLWDITPQAFADSLGIAQGTSADLAAHDGNANTFALYETKETASPMAEAVFDLWCYGQSAYVPSVAQMRLLYTIRETVNPVIEQCGGDPLPLTDGDCWYWTSTEVAEQETAKAWLYSMGSGAIQETPHTGAQGTPDYNHQPVNQRYTIAFFDIVGQHTITNQSRIHAVMPSSDVCFPRHPRGRNGTICQIREFTHVNCLQVAPKPAADLSSTGTPPVAGHASLRALSKLCRSCSSSDLKSSGKASL